MTLQTQSDLVIFCIYMTPPRSGRKKKDGYSATECEEFLRFCTKRYEKKRGVKPNTAIVPEDYCGGLDVIKGLQIKKGAKPRGHYLVGVSSEES